MDPPPLTRIFRAVGRTQGSHEPPNPGNKPGEIHPLTGNRAHQAPRSGIKNALGKAAVQSPWFSENAENLSDWSEKTYLNIFGSLPKNFGRPSKTSKWKYISFSKRYRILRDHTYWFRLLSTRVRAKLLNLSTVQLQSTLDFPDLVISSAWYSGAGYYFCDRIAKCLITVQLISNHFLTTMMGSLKEWRKQLRKSYFIGGPWIEPPKEWSLFTHHPLRGVFHLRETWVLQRVITLTETRSTGLATRDMCREKVNDFISVTCGSYEDPPRRQISIGNLRGRPHRQPTISLSGSATFEFTRKMRGHFGHVVSILDSIGDSEVRLTNLDGVESILPPGSHLLDRWKRPDYLVWFGKELVPNLLTPHLGSIVFSKCLEEFYSRDREFISARILTVKERGKARILLCSESFYSQLQFPFSKLVNSALEDTPEYSTGLRGTDDSWAAFRDIPNLDEDTQCAFICSDLTEATDSPPFWVVEECIIAFHSKGWISTFYRDLLIRLVNLPRRFEWPPNSGKYHLTRRGSPMGDPITKSCITIVSGLCIREALSSTRYKFFYRVKGDDLLIAILGTVPNYDCVQVLERLIQYLLDHGLRPSDLDTFISGFAFYCEGAFIAPYWYNSFKIVQSRKIENVFIDPVKGRYLLPLFKKDSARPHNLGELPVAKIQQLNKQIAYYKPGTVGFHRVNDMIRTQRVCFRSGHLRDFWYPFPTSVGGLDGFLGLEPPTEWLKNQENWFYWTYLYLCVRSSLLTLREEIFPPEVRELFDTTFRRTSDFSYSGKHILRRIDLSEFGYTPIWNSSDEKNFGTLLYPELTSYGEVSTEMSIISRLDSYKSMCTDGDNRYSNYFTSSLKAFEKKALPPFPSYRKSTVWKIYISKPKNLHSGSPWTLYYKEGPGNYLHSSLRVGTSTDVAVRPNIEQNLRFIEGVRSGEFKTSPTNADSDLEIAIQLRNCLAESKDQFVWAHINSRDFSMRNGILHFCKEFLRGRTLLLYFSSWWIQQELIRSKGTCDLTFREIYAQSYEDRATVLRCGRNYFSNFKFFVSVNGDDFVRPKMADFSEIKFQFIEVFVDFTNVQYQMLDSGYTYATISGGIEIDNLEPCKRFHRLAGNTRQSLSQRHEFDDVDSIGSAHSLPLPPDEVRLVHSYDVLRRARAARMGLIKPRPPSNRSDSPNWRNDN